MSGRPFAGQMPPGAFSIGSAVWPGVGKVLEESGEVAQCLGKLIASGGHADHWDGSDLRFRLSEEIADLCAALEFLIESNGLPASSIRDHTQVKLQQFREWHVAAWRGITEEP